MQPIWQALIGLIHGQSSGGIDTTIALTVAVFAFISVFAVAYILMKFFSLPDERVGSVQPEMHGAITSSQQIITGEAPRTRQEFVRALERTKAPLLRIYRIVMHFGVGLFVLGG